MDIKKPLMFRFTHTAEIFGFWAGAKQYAANITDRRSDLGVFTYVVGPVNKDDVKKMAENFSESPFESFANVRISDQFGNHYKLSDVAS